MNTRISTFLVFCSFLFFLISEQKAMFIKIAGVVDGIIEKVKLFSKIYLKRTPVKQIPENIALFPYLEDMYWRANYTYAVRVSSNKVP
ncbi:hypothetical protein KFZ70_03145 [Tamlana fucoidanivorans]|uniref:Uncharacterized protein n=1 Tax=Allotamlana fucoidanivorans TaxID=2583814 RepID=A0A5C4SK36_9FLAO|nr:hypothetical protein [Tamlana fucoidanivorans]TNJ44306.1 hypothetical protein FGF67_09775 [Tamlana fucoidanivorans]